MKRRNSKTIWYLSFVVLVMSLAAIHFCSCNTPLSGDPNMDGDNGKSAFCDDVCDDVAECGLHSLLGYQNMDDCKKECDGFVELYECLFVVASCTQVETCLKYVYGDRDDSFESSCEYSMELVWLYEECDYTYYDGSKEYNLNEYLDECIECHGECASKYIDENDCSEARQCIVSSCW